MPTPEETDAISEEIFQKTGFPFVQGVVDGTHIEISKPFGEAQNNADHFLLALKLI